MTDSCIRTRRLELIPQTLEQVHAQIAGMSADERAQLSAEWLARLQSPAVDQWTLGFVTVHRATDIIIGTCGFKGPPSADGMVEIAYGVEPGHQGNGYATEAAEALVAYAFSNGQVRTVRAHTLPEPNASTRVLTKCGFQALGEVTDPEDGLVWRWERTSYGPDEQRGGLNIRSLPMELVWPAARYLTGYAQALQQGWSPDNLRPEAAQEHLARIADSADRFLAEQVDRDAKGPPVTLPDGSTVPRLPGYSRWMWDGEFCGAINFRWQPGTSELPPDCLGHIGYSVVPWKQRRGYATRALQLLLSEIRDEGLSYVELITEASNIPSRRVIEANGGELIERFRKSTAHGGAESLRFRIPVMRG